MRAAVEFGPVGPAYAADYRKFLHALEDDSLRPSGELELMTLLFTETKGEFRLPGAAPENPLLGLLVSPASLNRRATLLETFASLQPELEEASRLAVLPVEYRKNVPSKDPVRSYLASTLLPYFFQRIGNIVNRKLQTMTEQHRFHSFQKLGIELAFPHGYQKKHLCLICCMLCPRGSPGQKT